MTTTGLVLILLARAAYLSVLDVSDKLDLAGETQAICGHNRSEVDIFIYFETTNFTESIL